MLNVTQNRAAVITFRWSITAVFTLWMFASSAPAQRVQPAAPTSISGVYNGSYTGDQGAIKFKLSITQQANGTVAGTFTMNLPDGSDTKPYTCDVKGRYIAPNRMIQLTRGKWETQPPAGVDMLGMNGTFDPAGGDGAGQISGRLRGRPGPQFQAIRDADESAKFASAAPATDAPATAAPAPVVAPPMRQPAPGRPDVARTPAAPVPAAPVVTGPAAVNGVYTGEFKHGNDTMKLKVSIKAADDGALTAVYTLDPPARKKGTSVTYKLSGKYTPGAKEYGVGACPYEFTTIEPLGSDAQEALAASQVLAVHIGITGPGTINGSMTGSGPPGGESIWGFISAKRDNAQSADLDKIMVAQGSGTESVVPVAPDVQPAYAGVYNGTATDKDGTNKFRLTIWRQREVRAVSGQLVNTELGGLLTVLATDPSGTMPYTTPLKGTFNATRGTFGFSRSGRYDPPPSGIFIANGVRGKFELGGAAPRITGDFDQPSGPKIEATRDAAESSAMNLERLRKHVYPGTVGVFNGTYTRQNEPPAKFKLSIHHNGNTAEVVAVATIYLPAGSGTQGYSYDLIGLAIDHGHFELRVHDWVTPPPPDFKNFKGMGFNGKMVLDESFASAKIISTPPASSMADFYVPQFEATWDVTESSDLDGTLAAQKAIGSGERVAAMKARDELLKNAPPKELASKDLVRKSKAYWDGYQTDMIREVFDGGFGGAMGDNEVFQETFVTYVDMFSAHCAEFLPPDHKKVTITMKTNRKADKYGNIISEDVKTFTVDMDSRFVDTYTKYHALLNSNDATMRRVMTAALPGGTERVIGGMMDIATDMQKFVVNHGGKSAAMRQMNENFLRAIHGDLSLQQANGKIDGAQAESDKDVPAGKYVRFVDAANAHFRAQRFASPSHDTALCQRLAELYQFKMTREEEYYYANDFQTRYLPIMGQRANCPDPAWPELHPAVEQALGEVK